MKQMRILKMFGNPALKAGSERAMHLAAKSLIALNHEVFLMHDSEVSAATGHYSGVHRVAGLFSRQIALSGANKIKQEVVRFVALHKINIIHLHEFPHPDLLVWLCGLIPVIASIHVVMCPNGARFHWKTGKCCERNIGFGCLTAGYGLLGCGHLSNGVPWRFPGFFASYIRDLRLRNCLSELSKIVVNGPWIYERLVKDGCDAGKLRVVPPPLQRGAAVSGTKHETPVIVFVGRLVEFKGPHHLLRASGLISLPHEVWFIGDGPMRHELEAMAAAANSSTVVRFLGEHNPDELDALRTQTSVTVIPSLAPETFCLAGGESLRLAIPVVAYNVGGIPDWLVDGEVGFLAEAGDIAALAAGIEYLLANPELAASMGRAGCLKAEQWQYHLHGAKLVEVYEEALHEQDSKTQLILPTLATSDR